MASLAAWALPDDETIDLLTRGGKRLRLPEGWEHRERKRVTAALELHARAVQPLAELVRSVREREHLSLRDLAQASGVSEDTLRRLEAGKDLTAILAVAPRAIARISDRLRIARAAFAASVAQAVRPLPQPMNATPDALAAASQDRSDLQRWLREFLQS